MINEEVASKSVEVGVRVTNLSLDLILKALAYLAEKLEGKDKSETPGISPAKHDGIAPAPEVKEGQMTLKELKKQTGDLVPIELKDPNLRLLKKTLNKNEVDFSVVKDGKGQYTLFFKGNDADCIRNAINKYTQKLIKMDKGVDNNKPSINKSLEAAKKLAQSLNAGKDKEKTKSRGAR